MRYVCLAVNGITEDMLQTKKKESFFFFISTRHKYVIQKYVKICTSTVKVLSINFPLTDRPPVASYKKKNILLCVLVPFSFKSHKNNTISI
jgi:hypothetical protein